MVAYVSREMQGLTTSNARCPGNAVLHIVKVKPPGCWWHSSTNLGLVVMAIFARACAAFSLPVVASVSQSKTMDTTSHSPLSVFSRLRLINALAPP